MRHTLLILLSGVALTAIGCPSEEPPPPESPELLQALFIDAELPLTDPLSAVWDDAPEYRVPLELQNWTQPSLLEAGVTQVDVRAVYNHDRVVFRLSWDDRTRDTLEGNAQFSDGAAVQVPADPTGDAFPSQAMGDEETPVRIFFWKADWQETTDAIAELYPYASIDHYPYEAASPEHREQLERLYAPARHVENPRFAHIGERPVQTVMAAGFGSLEPTPEQDATGNGIWRGRRWHLTIAAPVAEVVGNVQSPGPRWVAFAVWDGSRAETGARKMRSNWVELELAGPRTPGEQP